MSGSQNQLFQGQTVPQPDCNLFVHSYRLYKDESAAHSMQNLIASFRVGACVPLRPPAHYGDPALCESSGPLEITELVPVR